MNSNGNWKLRIRSKVFKVLEKFPYQDRDRLLAGIERLPVNPYEGNTAKMEGEMHTWRKRIGNYRIFFELIPKDKSIYVFRLERRTSTTY